MSGSSSNAAESLSAPERVSEFGCAASAGAERLVRQPLFERLLANDPDLVSVARRLCLDDVGAGIWRGAGGVDGQAARGASDPEAVVHRRDIPFFIRVAIDGGLTERRARDLALAGISKRKSSSFVHDPVGAIQVQSERPQLAWRSRTCWGCVQRIELHAVTTRGTWRAVPEQVAGLVHDRESAVGQTAEPAVFLQAVEAGGDLRVQGRAVRFASRVYEGVQCDAAVSRVRNGGANQPNRAAVTAQGIEVAFHSAGSSGRGRKAIGFISLQLAFNEMEFGAGFDERRAIQSQAVTRSHESQRGLAIGGLPWAETLGRIPEVSNDPEAEKIIAVVTQLSAAVDGISIGAEAPVLAQIGSRHTGYAEAIACGDERRVSKGRCARRGVKNAVRSNLADSGVRFELSRDILQGQAACVARLPGLVCRIKEILIVQKCNDGNELGGRPGVVFVAAGSGENADVVTVGITVGVVDDPIELAGSSWRAGLPNGKAGLLGEG